MRTKKIAVMILAIIMVLSMTTMAFAAPYDFTHKTDETKAYTFLDVASTSTVLLDVVSNQSSYLIEGNEGEQYELDAVMALADTGMTFAEAFDELDPYEEPVDFTALDEAKAAAEELVEEEYTAETWAELDAALALSEETQEEVDAKVVAINEAIDALVVLSVDVLEFVDWNYVDGDTQLNVIVRELLNDGTYGEEHEYVVLDTISDPDSWWNVSGLEVYGERMSPVDLVEGDDVKLHMVANNVRKIEVTEVDNDDHITVNFGLDTTELTTCAAAESDDIWFSNATNVAVTVTASDSDWGTDIDFVTLNYGDDSVSTTENSLSGVWNFGHEFTPFTTEGTFELSASATNDADYPVTKDAEEAYTLVIDMTAPEIEVSYPTTSTSVELNAGDTFTADGTYDELNGFKEFEAIVIEEGEWSTGYNDVTVNDDGTWNIDFDLSVVDFNDNTTTSAVLVVMATDCAGNPSEIERVEFELKDETAPVFSHIMSAGEDWIQVAVDENFKLNEDVGTVDDYNIIVNNADQPVNEVKLGQTEEGQYYLVLWTETEIIYDDDVLNAEYLGGVIVDSAGNVARERVTVDWSGTLTEEAPLEPTE